MMSAMSERPRFSTIMPVYNHADYLAEAVASVRAQTRDDWELILVDDGSTDGSADQMDALSAEDDRIRVIHQANAGPAAARNAALAVARGDWLTYLDSDDVWYPDALETFAGYTDPHDDCRFCYGYRHRLEAGGAITKLPGEFQDRPTGPAELFGRMFLSHLCVCYRRSLIDQAGPYDPTLRSCEDYDLYLRMSPYVRFEPTGRPTGLRRRHATNLSRQTGRSQLLEAAVLRRFVEHFGGREVLDGQLIDRRIGRLYYRAQRQFFRERAYRASISAGRQAARFRATPKGQLLTILAGLLRPLDARPTIDEPRLSPQPPHPIQWQHPPGD